MQIRIRTGPTRFWSRGAPAILSLAIGFWAVSASADEVYSGVDGSTETGNTGSGNSGFIVGTYTGEASYGGEGVGNFSFNALSSQGDISIAGNVGTAVNSPLLKLRSDGPGAATASQSFIGAMETYQYTGSAAETVSYNWALTAELVEPTGTSAFLRARAALLTEAEFYSTSISNFFESSTTVEDTMSFTQSDAGLIDESGTISFDADPGEVFYLVTSLQTYAGHTGAIANGYNTFSGNFSSSEGGGIVSLSAIPEPSSALMFCLIGPGALLFRRRRN